MGGLTTEDLRALTPLFTGISIRTGNMHSILRALHSSRLRDSEPGPWRPIGIWLWQTFSGEYEFMVRSVRSTIVIEGGPKGGFFDEAAILMKNELRRNS